MLRQNPGLNLSRDAQSRSAMCSPSTAPAHHGARLCAIQVRQAPAQHSACPSQRPSTTALAHHTPSWRSGRGLPLSVGEGRRPGRDAHLRVKESQSGSPLSPRLVVPCGVARSTVSTLIIRDHPRSSEAIRAHLRRREIDRLHLNHRLVVVGGKLVESDVPEEGGSVSCNQPPSAVISSRHWQTPNQWSSEVPVGAVALHRREVQRAAKVLCVQACERQPQPYLPIRGNSRQFEAIRGN